MAEGWNARCVRATGTRVRIAVLLYVKGREETTGGDGRDEMRMEMKMKPVLVLVR